MRNNISFNKDNDKLGIDDNAKQKNYPLLSTLNVPFTSYTMSILLYEIITTVFKNLFNGHQKSSRKYIKHH